MVGEAADVASAVDAAERLRPDVVLMDLHLPDGWALDATRAVLAAAPGTRVLVMTMSSDDDAVVAAMRAGARGYVVKGVSRDELLAAVRSAAAGAAVFSAGVADRLGAFFAGLGALPGREVFPQLTEREREVLDLLARGYDDRRIARELFLSDKTVRNHLSSVFTELDVPDRTTAAVRSRNAGLGSCSASSAGGAAALALQLREQLLGLGLVVGLASLGEQALRDAGLDQSLDESHGCPPRSSAYVPS